MENIIRELIQIESSADAIVHDVMDEKQHLDQRILDTKNEIQENVAKHTEEQIQQIADAAHEEASLKVDEINRNSQQWFSSLEQEFQVNHAKWEADLVNQIIGQ